MTWYSIALFPSCIICIMLDTIEFAICIDLIVFHLAKLGREDAAGIQCNLLLCEYSVAFWILTIFSLKFFFLSILIGQHFLTPIIHEFVKITMWFSRHRLTINLSSFQLWWGWWGQSLQWPPCYLSYPHFFCLEYFHNWGWLLWLWKRTRHYWSSKTALLTCA